MSGLQTSEFQRVGNNAPCIVCGSKRRCTFSIDSSGNGVVKCSKVSDGSFRSGRDAVGTHYVHKVRDGKPVSNIEPPELDPGKLHSFYANLMVHLRGVASHHQHNLVQRGLSLDVVRSNGYRTFSAAASRTFASLLFRDYGSEARSVPGFWLTEDDEPRLTFPYVEEGPLRDTLLIPCRSITGKIFALKQRIDDPRWSHGKYSYLTSSNHGGRKAIQGIHFPKGTPQVCPRLRISEGELKADVAFHLTGVPTASLPGVGSWRKALPACLETHATEVLLAFDSDARSNPDVAAPLRDLFQELRNAGLSVSIEHWPSHPDLKGIDDLLAAGHAPELASGSTAVDLLAEIVKSSGVDKLPPVASRKERPKVFCRVDESSVNDEVIKHLADVPTVYQRGGQLVRIIRDRIKSTSISRPDGTATIQALPEASLREMLSSVIDFQDQTDNGVKTVRVPHFVTKAIHQRGEWDGIRCLQGVSTNPVLRPDGTVCAKPGFDEATGLFLYVQDDLVDVPNFPSLNDVLSAVSLLKDIVYDFPFEEPAHLSGWLALVLTILARPAFDGPAPLFLADANTRGSGKSLLMDLASIITAGQDFARMSNMESDDEFRKAITSIAQRGDPLILIDNVVGSLGCPSLDSALTSTFWTDRILGQTAMTTLPMRAIWTATGNNVILTADATRRTCHIRLRSLEERPEERSDFRYQDLMRHTREHRSELLSAALTILRGYCAAGRPDLNLKRWGSFEGWSSVVRGALVWAGETDPADAREGLTQQSDAEANTLHELIHSWSEAFKGGDGRKTAAQILTLIDIASGDQCVRFKNAVLDLCGATDKRPPSSKTLGKRLRQVKGRVADGKFVDCKPNREKTLVWFVGEIESPDAFG